jgi:hypothetical protein
VRRYRQRPFTNFSSGICLHTPLSSIIAVLLMCSVWAWTTTPSCPQAYMASYQHSNSQIAEPHLRSFARSAQTSRSVQLPRSLKKGLFSCFPSRNMRSAKSTKISVPSSRASGNQIYIWVFFGAVGSNDINGNTALQVGHGHLWMEAFFGMSRLLPLDKKHS